MTEQELRLFRESVGRCVEDSSFLQDFYDRFIASSDEVREKFKDTDFATQKRVLAESLFLLAVALQSKRTSDSWHDLERTAKHHSRGELDIRPELYDLWLECLLESVERHDPHYSTEIGASWRAVLGEGIAFMRSRY